MGYDITSGTWTEISHASSYLLCSQRSSAQECVLCATVRGLVAVQQRVARCLLARCLCCGWELLECDHWHLANNQHFAYDFVSLGQMDVQRRAGFHYRIQTGVLQSHKSYLLTRSLFGNWDCVASTVYIWHGETRLQDCLLESLVSCHGFRT